MRERDTVTGTLRTKTPVIPILILLAILALLLAGCGRSEDETSSTSEISSATSSTNDGDEAAASDSTTVSTETIVVGGSTREEYEAALPELEQAVESNDQDIDALQELAIAQFWTERYEEAAATYEKMLQIEDDPFTRNNYANVLRKWGKTDEAKAQYEQALAADPTLTVAYINLAILLSQQGDNPGALEILKSGLEKVKEEDKTSLQTYIDELTSTTTTT